MRILAANESAAYNPVRLIYGRRPKRSRHPDVRFTVRSTGWTVIGGDLPDNSRNLKINHTRLDSEYFVTGDTAHTPMKIEVAPMTIKADITHLILLADCSQPPFYVAKGQIIAQTIPIPVEVPVEEKASDVYWAEVVYEEKPMDHTISTWKGCLTRGQM
ncbi:hypothetical protein TURU_016843 [Turdus rufiventris]|nr:hypothetical protein TURU_016843 [Turdus rufiventris]